MPLNSVPTAESREWPDLSDVPVVEALVTEIHGLLHLLLSERPALAAANIPVAHPVRLPHISGGGPAACRHSGG